MTKAMNKTSTQAGLRPTALDLSAGYPDENDLVGALVFAACEQPASFNLVSEMGSLFGEHS